MQTESRHTLWGAVERLVSRPDEQGNGEEMVDTEETVLRQQVESVEMASRL